MNFAFNNQTPDYIGIGNQNFFGNTNQNNLFGGNPFFGKNVCTAQSCNCYVCQRNQQAKQNEYAMYNFEDVNKMAKQKEALRRQRVEEEADRKQAKRQEALRRQRVEEEANRKRVKQKEALRRQRVEEEADRKRVKQIEALRRQRVEKEADRKQAKKKEALRRLRVEKEADRKRIKQRQEAKAKANHFYTQRDGYQSVEANRFWKANGAFFMVSID